MEIITNRNVSENAVYVYIMESSGKAFAELSYFKNETHIMTFSNLNVEKRFRRKGLATDLISTVTKIAMNKSCEYLYLNADKSNEWLCAWYRKLGFIAYNETDDGLLNMYKKLN